MLLLQPLPQRLLLLLLLLLVSLLPRHLVTLRRMPSSLLPTQCLSRAFSTRSSPKGGPPPLLGLLAVLLLDQQQQQQQQQQLTLPARPLLLRLSCP